MASAAVPALKLKSGHSIPQLGLGTWMSSAGEVHNAVKAALRLGYRHIDTAHAYGNHKEIGAALTESFAEGVVSRADVFITSKVWNTFHSFDRATESIDVFLAELQVDYLDLVLIHWPMGYREGGEMFPKTEDGKGMNYSDVDWLDTWRALQAAVQNSKVRSIGVSNFNAAQMKRVIEFGGPVPCSNLQIELHPYLPQSSLVALCLSHGVTVTAYSPLANNAHMFRQEGDRNLLQEPILNSIGDAHKKSSAQIVLRWFIQKGLIVIPKSVTPSRIAENFALFDFELSLAEMAAVDTLSAVNWRILKLERDLVHPHYPFH